MVEGDLPLKRAVVYELSAEDTDFWGSSGYWISPVLLDLQRVDILKEHVAQVLMGHYDTGKSPIVDPWNRANDLSAIQNVDNAHWADSVISRLTLDPAIGEIAANLLKVNTVRLWASQILHKPGGGAKQSNVGWHRDMTYWQCAFPPDMVTAWIPLDNVDQENGCLQFIPGSHCWPSDAEFCFFEGAIQEQFQRIRARFGDCPVHAARMKVGQISFHHCLTLHASGPNLTRNPRQAISIHFMAGHVWYRAQSSCDSHINVRLLDGRDGYPYSGRHFPVVYTSEGSRRESALHSKRTP